MNTPAFYLFHNSDCRIWLNNIFVICLECKKFSKTRERSLFAGRSLLKTVYRTVFLFTFSGVAFTLIFLYIQ